MVLRILNVSLCQVVGGVVGLISEHLFSQRVCVLDLFLPLEVG